MDKERFLNLKVKPLEFKDDPPGKYDLSGKARRTQAITDTRVDGKETHDNAVNGPRMYNSFLVFMDNADNIFAASALLGKTAVPVGSFEEGKALCEKWHQEY